MGESLFAAVGIQAIVSGRCADVRIEWTLAHAGAVGGTATIELEGPKLHIGIVDLAACIAVGRISSMSVAGIVSSQG